MSFIFWLRLYLLTTPVFFTIVMIWLGYAARIFYKTPAFSPMPPLI